MYSIGQVSKLLKVPTHVIRYWEREIPLVSPGKDAAGRRSYSQSDLHRLYRLRFLLYERRYTLQGARNILWREIRGGRADLKFRISEVRDALLELEKNTKPGSHLMDGDSLEKIYTDLGQGQLFSYWSARGDSEKKRLLQDLSTFDPQLLDRLKQAVEENAVPSHQIEPAPFIPLSQIKEGRGTGEVGIEAIQSGKTAFLTVAGGQGSRLGFEGPKGMVPTSPIRHVTLFQLYAERILAASRRYDTDIVWYIMTSLRNHHATVSYFEENGYFGLDEDDVIFFSQGFLPTLDEDGKLQLAEDGGLLCNPDGHGGVVAALRNAGILEGMRSRGIEYLFYFQIDNPLVNVPDPVFLGYHLEAGAEVSTKVIEKRNPDEKLGIIALIDGRPGVIEYSDLDRKRMYEKDQRGKLLFSHGNVAIHVLNTAFLSSGVLDLPYHIARKTVKVLKPGIDQSEVVDREGVKLEKFIFDVIPLADRGLFYETSREEEFAPLKNRSGDDSIETCVLGQINKAARYLEFCGIEIPKDNLGTPQYKYEISPVFAIDAYEFREKIRNQIVDAGADRLFL